MDINQQGNRIITCPFAVQSWYCPNGHVGPWELGGNCGGHYIITIIEVPCGDTGGGGGDGGGEGGGGSSSGSGSIQTIILEICDDFTHDGGPGNSEDCEDDYAAYFIPYICDVDYSLINYINNWAPSNQQAASDLANYLANNYNGNCAIVDFEELIILNEAFVNNPKMNCAYKKVKQAGGLRQLSANFFDEDNGDWGILDFKVIKNLNCNNGDPNGCTRASYIEGNLESVIIEIDEDYINNLMFAGVTYQTPMLYLARTLLHESIHANLYFALNELTNGNISSPYISEFETLYEEYRSEKNWQHPFMAQHYIDIIAQELQNVHPLIGDQTFINNNSHYNWDDFYKNLAWVGLQNTSAFSGYQNNPQNFDDFRIFNIDALSNSTKIQNCN